MNIVAMVFMRAAQAFCAGVILYLWFVASAVSAQGDTPPDIEIQEQKEELERRAKQAADVFRRKGMVDLIDQMGTRVRGALGVIDDRDMKDKELLVNPSFNSFRAVLFASSSIPLTTLRSYAAQLEKVNGVIVFRGVPGGISAIRPIVELTHKIILKDPDCIGQDCDVYEVGVILDPLMFRNNRINQVPAVTIVDHDPFGAYCERPQEEQSGSLGRYVTYGDAHLSGHFTALEEFGDQRASLLLHALNRQEGDVP